MLFSFIIFKTHKSSLPSPFAIIFLLIILKVLPRHVNRFFFKYISQFTALFSINLPTKRAFLLQLHDFCFTDKSLKTGLDVAISPYVRNAYGRHVLMEICTKFITFTVFPISSVTFSTGTFVCAWTSILARCMFVTVISEVTYLFP